MSQSGNAAPRFIEGGVPKGSSVKRSDDYSTMSDISKCESVAFDALGSIMLRIEEAKTQLEENTKVGKDIESQVELAKLIEKLASAAVAVRKLEDM